MLSRRYRKIYRRGDESFDCSEDLYGKQAEVSLLKFLRPEQKFVSIDALKNQLDHDVAAGKNM